MLKRFLFSFLSLFSLICVASAFAAEDMNIPILCYHNFNPVKPGPMNLTPQKFESQLSWMINNGFKIIPLKEAVEYLQGKRGSVPAKSVVITVDDGWQSNYTYLAPIIKKYKVPVTLFIYPQTISKGKNSMTWEELKELQATGLFDVQAHTYSHPNFKIEKKHMDQQAYETFVTNELVNSKKILEEKMGQKVSFLAWPFGIHDDFLEEAAKKAGYEMSFSIAARSANKTFKSMAQPRFMIIDSLTTKRFENIANGAKA